MQADPSVPRTVVRLEVDSYKRLRAAEVTPTPTGLVPVRGRNAQGKSSLIEAMLDALGAERSEVPIRAGEHGAQVVMHLGDDLVVTKRWTRDAGGEAKASITVEGVDGARMKSPAEVLKSLRGRFADPVAFLDLPPADQVKTVLGVLGLDQELARLEGIAQGHYDARRDFGREADRTAKVAAELTQEIAGLPPVLTESTIDQLTAELQAAKDHNARMIFAERARADVEREGKDLATRLGDLATEIASAQTEFARLEAARADAIDRWKVLATETKSAVTVDVNPIVEKIRMHEMASKHAARVEMAAKAAADAERARAAHAESEASLKATRDAITEMLGRVAFPVEGMSYDPDAKTLTIGGIPFGQASQAERLKAAAAIAMAGSPSIRVLFAREGSLLDDESRAQLAALASEAGFQLWLEVVDSHADGAGVWIEDGEAFQNDGALETGVEMGGMVNG